jgi:signal transduction histidine kinase
MGFTVSQVVHDYGDVCQTITELAVDKKAAISAEEFHTLNRCLDTAIAAAVTEYGRLRDEASAHHELERLGQVAHELRNLLQTAMLSFQVLKSGRVGITGSTGAVLGRTLIDLRDLVDGAISEVRLAGTTHQRHRVPLTVFIEEVAVAANLHAMYREIRLTICPVDPLLAMDVDPHLLASALMNLLYNAFKYTPANGHVSLRTRAANGRIFIEVEDECGGLDERASNLFRPFGDRRASDRSGLGLGLSISRKAVTANGGEIHAVNLPGKGCIFTIELPLASPPVRAG